MKHFSLLWSLMLTSQLAFGQTPVVITIDNTQTQLISCFGASDGAMGILVEGGQPPYMVQWSNGSSGPVIGQLP